MATSPAEYAARVLKARQFLEQHLDEPLDPTQLARAAHFSLHHFHRIFKAQTGESAMQHVRRLRLERAARRIRTSDARLLEIALEAGYESHEAFTRAFIERFAMPPSEYRELPSTRLQEWQAEAPRRPGIEVRVAEYPSIRASFMRASGSYAAVGETWQRLRAWAAEQGIAGNALYGLCPDDPEVTPEPLLRFDACVAVSGDIGAMTEIPAGTYAVGLHVGPYHRLHETYLEIIGRWLPTSGYEPTIDPVVEHYVSDPGCTPEAELQTEVRVRLA